MITHYLDLPRPRLLQTARLLGAGGLGGSHGVEKAQDSQCLASLRNKLDSVYVSISLPFTVKRNLQAARYGRDTQTVSRACL